MPRSIWNGVISFGMVSIPVKLYTATQSKDISFHLLHKECGTRLQQLRWCPEHERAVEWGEVVRGYEYAREEHVVMTDEDFEKLPLRQAVRAPDAGAQEEGPDGNREDRRSQ